MKLNRVRKQLFLHLMSVDRMKKVNCMPNHKCTHKHRWDEKELFSLFNFVEFIAFYLLLLDDLVLKWWEWWKYAHLSQYHGPKEFGNFSYIKHLHYLLRLIDMWTINSTYKFIVKQNICSACHMLCIIHKITVLLDLLLKCIQT